MRQLENKASRLGFAQQNPLQIHPSLPTVTFFEDNITL
jgi:hypothetical protein